MALQKGSMRVALGGGIETKLAPEAVPSTRLLALENGVFTRGSSIRKRNGYTQVGEDVDYKRLASRGDELIAFSRTNAYTIRSDEADRDEHGSVFSVVGTDVPVCRTGTEQTHPDHATNLGVSVAAWEDSRGGVWYSVFDTVTGRIFAGPTQANAVAFSPRCVACDDMLHVYYATATGVLFVLVVDPADPTASVTPAALISDLSTTNPVFDAEATTKTGTPTVIAWHENGATRFRAAYVHRSGIIGSTLMGLPGPFDSANNSISSTSPIAVAWTPDAIDDGPGITVITQTNNGTGNVVAWHITESGGLLSYFAEVTVTPSTSPQRVTAAWTEDLDGALCRVAVEEAAAQPSNRYVVIGGVTDTGSLATRTQRSVGLASRAWAVDVDGVIDAFAYFLHDTTYFNVYVALRLGDSTPVARTLPGRAGDGPTRKHLSSAHVAGDVVRVALPYNERVPSANDDAFEETGIRLVTLDFDNDDSHQHARLGRGLYLGSACPMHYDGSRWTEQGFHVGPELITTANGGSGSLTSSSTYLYRCWYESTDAQGEVHRGPVSFGTLVTLGVGEDEVTLTLPTLRLTQKTNVRIVVARSRAAETGATAELFVCSSQDPTVTTGANRYVANDATMDTVTFIDRMSDATLAVQEPAYTNGGILSTDPAPLGHLVVEGKGRLFWNDPSDPNAVRYSQTIDEGYAVEAPPEFVLTVPPAGGPITALAVSEDGAVLVFKRESIFTFVGAGPAPNGDVSAGGFSEPLKLRSPVGCAEPAAVVTAPGAVLFKSEQGVWQVDGAGQVSYVGGPVEAYNSQRLTAATLLPGRTQIVFLSETGYTLLYDYLFDRWSTFTNHAGLDAHVTEDAYHYLRTDGKIYREAIGVYSDAGQRITLRLETAWIHLAEALQGFQRIWNVLVLGTWLSPHQLAISHRSDYATGQLPTSEPTAWTDPWYADATGEDSGSTGWVGGDNADVIGEDPILGDDYGDGLYGDGVYGGEGADVYQWRYHVGERGSAIQLRFEDFERTGLAGASFELTELLIEGGIAGTARKPFPGSRSG